MSSSLNNLKTLIGLGSRSVELIRRDPTSPAGKYFASININGLYNTEYNCCVMCKQLLKSGKTCAIQQWKHKTRHLAKGEKYSNQELEEIVRSFNSHHSQSNRELSCEQVKSTMINQSLFEPKITKIQPGPDKVLEIPNETLCP